MKNRELIKKTKEINRFLRIAYAKSIKKRKAFNIPFCRSIKESIGAFVEVIYKGLPCPYSLKGTCAPCGYSNIPVAVSKEKIWQSLVTQTDYILKNFEKLILKKDKVDLPHDPKNLVRFALSPTGSFFSNFEIPPKYRKEILEKFLRFSKERNFEFEIFIEARAEDIINLTEREKREITNILNELNVTILLGLESINDLTRNVIYCKDLELNDFEKAIEIIRKDLKCKSGAFIFAGLHSMNEIETFNDIKKTLLYLKKRKILPVIMIENLKSFTLPHLLYLYERHKMIDPFTIHKIILFMSSIFENKKLEWLFADPVGGPPAPKVHAFKNRTKIACPKCSNKILKGIRNLRENYSFNEYLKTTNAIENHKCFLKYESYLNSLKSQKNLKERVKSNLDFALKKKVEYVKKISF